MSPLYQALVRRVDEREAIRYLENCLIKKAVKWCRKWLMYNEPRIHCHYLNGDSVAKRVLKTWDRNYKSLMHYYFINYNFWFFKFIQLDSLYIIFLRLVITADLIWKD